VLGRPLSYSVPVRVRGQAERLGNRVHPRRSCPFADVPSARPNLNPHFGGSRARVRRTSGSCESAPRDPGHGEPVDEAASRAGCGASHFHAPLSHRVRRSAGSSFFRRLVCETGLHAEQRASGRNGRRRSGERRPGSAPAPSPRGKFAPAPPRRVRPWRRPVCIELTAPPGANGRPRWPRRAPIARGGRPATGGKCRAGGPRLELRIRAMRIPRLKNGHRTNLRSRRKP
jgi:hypothetical protein